MPPVAVSQQELDDMSAAASFCVIHDIKPEDMPTPCGGAAPAPSRRTITRRRSVDFSGENKVIEFEKPEEEERENIWYSRDEYDIIKARNSLIVKMMKKGNFTENEEHSFRGLEHKLRDGFKQRRDNKFAALNSVLEEQDRQYARGLKDDSNIAQKYEEVVINAKQSAFYLGMKDHEQSLAYQPPTMENPEDDDSEASDISDLASQCSEDTQQKKMRLKSLFHHMSHRKKGQTSRRASM